MTDQNPRYYAKSDFGDPSTLNLDLERMALDDASFDVVIASHVLEHVDDRKALSELRRVVREAGTVVLMVPIIEGWSATFEDPTVSTPKQRQILFGQDDHIRYYGADFRDRVRSAGFRIGEHTAEEPAVTRYGLSRGEKVFMCSPS